MLVEIPTVQRPLQDLAAATPVITQVAYTAETMPALIEQQRLALQDAVRKERIGTLDDSNGCETKH